MTGPRGGAAGRGKGAFAFVEVLAVVLLAGILILAAIPNYFSPGGDARADLDLTNLRAINAALALYQARTGGCPPGPEAFDRFLSDPEYFPEGRPADPWADPPGAAPYVATYSAALCRVQVQVLAPRPIDHETGLGH